MRLPRFKRLFQLLPGAVQQHPDRFRSSGGSFPISLLNWVSPPFGPARPRATASSSSAVAAEVMRARERDSSSCMDSSNMGVESHYCSSHGLWNISDSAVPNRFTIEVRHGLTFDVYRGPGAAARQPGNGSFAPPRAQSLAVDRCRHSVDCWPHGLAAPIPGSCKAAAGAPTVKDCESRSRRFAADAAGYRLGGGAQFHNVFAPIVQAPDADNRGLVLIQLATNGGRVKEGDVIAQIDGQAVKDHLDDVESQVAQVELDMRSLRARQDSRREAMEQEVRVAKAVLEKAQQDMKAVAVKTEIQREQLRLALEEAQLSYQQTQSELALAERTSGGGVAHRRAGQGSPGAAPRPPPGRSRPFQHSGAAQWPGDPALASIGTANRRRCGWEMKSFRAWCS